MRRSDARSAQIGGPNGIAIGFQVKANSSEPFRSIAARNLFSKQDWRAALGDKPVEGGPEMPFVEVTSPPSDDRKRLTRT